MSDDIKIASEDEAAAWMYPSALEWFKTGEHSATAWPIKVGSPDEPSPTVPLYTADQLRAAVLADRQLHHSVLTARVAELEAHLRTIAKFGGTLDQARELAAKGIERAALLAKGE